jgi:hypothetical protein
MPDISPIRLAMPVVKSSISALICYLFTTFQQLVPLLPPLLPLHNLPMHLLRHLLISLLLFLGCPPILDRLDSPIPLGGFLFFHFLLECFGGLLVLK